MRKPNQKREPICVLKGELIGEYAAVKKGVLLKKKTLQANNMRRDQERTKEGKSCQSARKSERKGRKRGKESQLDS